MNKYVAFQDMDVMEKKKKIIFKIL